MKLSAQKFQSGFVVTSVLVLSVVIALSAAVVVEKTIGFPVIIQSVNPFPSPTPLPTLTPTPSPSPTPTPTLTPTPTNTPTPTKKPVPTQTPEQKAAASAPVLQGPPSSGYSRISVNTPGGTFTASVVSIPSSGVRMITDTANDDNCGGDCPTKSLGDFVAANGAFAGINGTYFCPNTYPDCQSKKDSFDFPVYNTRLGKWINADKLFWNGRSMVYQEGGRMGYSQNANGYGGGVQAGIVNYPGILNNGQVTVEQGSLSDKQAAKGTKGGIGFNDSTVFLVIASNVSMGDFAEVFKALGAKNALNLDGGGSAALWFGGYKVGPGRALPNAVLFAR